MLNRGFTHHTTGEPAVVHLAAAAEVSPTTVHRLIDGGGRATVRPDTISRLAEALNVSPTEVGQWVGVAWSEASSWEPPPEVNLLTRRERQAVEEVILCFASAKLNRGLDPETPEIPKRVVKGRAPQKKGVQAKKVARRSNESKGRNGSSS